MHVKRVEINTHDILMGVAACRDRYPEQLREPVFQMPEDSSEQIFPDGSPSFEEIKQISNT